MHINYFQFFSIQSNSILFNSAMLRTHAALSGAAARAARLDRRRARLQADEAHVLVTAALAAAPGLQRHGRAGRLSRARPFGALCLWRGRSTPVTRRIFGTFIFT